VIDQVAAELLPLKVAVMVALPDADEREVTLKLALTLPWGTVTVGGTVTPGLLLDRLTPNVPAALETETVQVVLAPAVRPVDRQATEDTMGLDHNVRLVVCAEVTSVACTEAIPSAAMFPTAAAKVALLLPAATVTLAGTVIAVEVELRVTTVLEVAACDSPTVQELVFPGITPLGLQASPVSTGATPRAMVVDWLEPL
jgi:hypothetical protein